jgi:transcription antitermination factor NusG
MNDISKVPKKWYVIVTKAINYKKADEILKKLGFSFYIPLQKQLHYWSDRKKWIDVPILNPYIFLFTDELERKIIFQSCNFFHFLNWGGKPAIVKEDEIEKVKMLCAYLSNVKIEQPTIKKGDVVEVVSGPLSGMKGYTLQENGKHRFLIQILSLGQFASVEIDSNWLRAC